MTVSVTQVSGWDPRRTTRPPRKQGGTWTRVCSDRQLRGALVGPAAGLQKFSGAILLTTNCPIQSGESSQDRISTIGLPGWLRVTRMSQARQSTLTDGDPSCVAASDRGS